MTQSKNIAQTKSYLLVYTTSNIKSVLVNIGNALIKINIASSYQIFGRVDSVYRWDGKIVKTKENGMYIMCRKEDFKKFEKTIKENHNYEIPQIIAFNIAKGSREYFNLIKINTKGC